MQIADSKKWVIKKSTKLPFVQRIQNMMYESRKEQNNALLQSFYWANLSS